jgi:hypothetical protein
MHGQSIYTNGANDQKGKQESINFKALVNVFKFEPLFLTKTMTCKTNHINQTKFSHGLPWTLILV